MSELFEFNHEVTKILKKMILAAIDLGARNSKRIIARIREGGINDDEVTDDQLRPLVQSILKEKGLFEAKNKVKPPEPTSLMPNKITDTQGNMLYKAHQFFQSMITPTGRVTQALGRVFALIFCALFLFIFYQFSQNGRYHIDSTGSYILDTRSGATYEVEGDPAKPPKPLNPPVK